MASVKRKFEADDSLNSLFKKGNNSNLIANETHVNRDITSYSDCASSFERGNCTISSHLLNENYYPTELPEANEETPEDLKSFNSLILEFVREQNIPGAGLSIAKGGTIIYTQCYGWATRGVKLRRHHRFRIASVSKVLTAMGVLKLHEIGKLKLNDKVFGPKGLLPNYSPSVSGDRRVLRITVRYLLQHSGGWDRDEAGDPCFWKHVGNEMGVPEPINQHTLIAYMMTQKLQFSPGTKHAYSNFGYVVLGRVVEHVSGQSYESFIRQLLASVNIDRMNLGKTRKSQAHPDEVEYFACPKSRQVASIFPGEGQVLSPYGGYSMEMGDADGGWIASATDIVRFFLYLEGFGTDSLIKQETFHLMLSKPSYAKGDCWYGLGLDVACNKMSWEHGGHVDGATCCVTRDFHGLTWAFLCNFWPSDSDYSSLISYAISTTSPWNLRKHVARQYSDVTTLDKKYVIKIKTAREDLNNFHQTFASLGYMPRWINGYSVNNTAYFNIIWILDNRKYKFGYDIAQDHINDYLDNATDQGFTILHIDSYLDSKVMYAVILLHTSDVERRVYIALSPEQLEEKTRVMKKENFLITVQSPTYFKNSVLISCIYEKSDVSAWWSKYDILYDGYEKEFNRHVRYGHLLSYIKPYLIGHKRYFSAIWTNPGPFKYMSEYDQSEYKVLNQCLYAAQYKFYPLCVSGYEECDEELGHRGHKFVSVFIKEL